MGGGGGISSYQLFAMCIAHCGNELHGVIQKRPMVYDIYYGTQQWYTRVEW